MSTAGNSFNCFLLDLINGVHDFDAHTFKVYLSNATPNAETHVKKADIAEISAGNGYTAGGNATTVTTFRSTITSKAVGTDPATWAASGGPIGPFRYAILYNDTPTTPNADPLIGWWDYGSALTLQNGETFTVDLDGTLGFISMA